MYLGYNTNGFAHHRLEDAIEIIADLGYQGVGLTVDYTTLNVLEPGWERKAERLRHQLEKHRLRVVIETGARFLLDPRRKHQPTLVSPTEPERVARLHFLQECIRLASLLHADAVSFWSGTPEAPVPGEDSFSHLVFACQQLCFFAQDYGVRLAFEPEPGMLIDSMATFNDFDLLVDLNLPNFGLTIDIGHLVCQGEVPASNAIRPWGHKLWNVHIEDMKPGVHDHLMFGEGAVDFADVFAALRAIDYAGGVFVELSRHSHDAVETARKSIAFLRQLMG